MDNTKSSVAFFYGLESPQRSEKNEILHKYYERVYEPMMDYYNPEMFNVVLRELKKNPVDLLVGSSMGGWFAYNLSTITGIPTLLFNPAVHSRSFSPNVKSGNKHPRQSIVLGKNDNVIDFIETIKYFNKIDIVTDFDLEVMEHRIPADIFEKYVKLSTY
jgi:predicted esterase YcpF (UPF0227 family)